MTTGSTDTNSILVEMKQERHEVNDLKHGVILSRRKSNLPYQFQEMIYLKCALACGRMFA